MVVVSTVRAHADPRSEAAAHFSVGIDLVDRHRWDSALAEFRRSNELLPTSGALENVAVCLRELGRFDEALDAYDELLARFTTTLSPTSRSADLADVARIADCVGTIAVSTSIAGAMVVVDGRERERTPLAKPLRATAGPHVVRVVAEGRAPFETRTVVSPKELVSISADLATVARVGGARVVEASGRVFEVLVDGARVGVTPWQGTLGVGDHTFALHGEGDVGAEPVTRMITYDDLQAVTLTAHLLRGVVRVEPDPTTATVAIDGIRVARGTWSGLLPSGDHTITLTAPWSERLTLPIHASSERPLTVRPALERIRRFYGEVDGGVLFGDVRAQGVSGCDDASCMGNIGIGRIGYSIARRVGVDVFIGGLALSQFASQPVLEQLEMGASLYGTAVSYELFERTPLLFRLGFAALYGGVTLSAQGDVRGSEASRAGSASFWSVAAMPEVRFGYRVSRAIVLDVGVMLLLFATPSVANVPGESSGLPVPTISRGVGYVIPITLGFKLFL